MKSSIVKSYILFALRLLLPLIVLPVLSHRLGAAGFGSVLAAQSLGLLGSLVVQFGFHHSATRKLGLAEHPLEVDQIIGAVLAAQIVTAALAAGLMLAGGAASPVIGTDPVVLFSVLLVGLGAGMSPAWYFRGTGRAPTGIALELAGQIISFVAIVALVRGPDDLILTILLIGIGPALGALIGIGWMLRERRCLIWPDFATVGAQIAGSFALFLVRASSTGMTIGAAWLASLLMVPTEVAYFGVAAKIVSALTMMSQPVLFAMLPVAARRAREGRRPLLKTATKWAGLLLCLGLVSAVGVQIFADLFLTVIFAPDMAAAGPVLRFLAWVCVLAALRDSLSDLVLVPMHRDKTVAACVIFGAGIALLMAFLLVPGSSAWSGAIGMASARMIGEAVTILFMSVAVARIAVSGGWAPPST